jgi:hypothetical protein
MTLVVVVGTPESGIPGNSTVIHKLLSDYRQQHLTQVEKIKLTCINK